MADYKDKIQSENRHLGNLTSARFVHIDGGKTAVTVLPGDGRLHRIVINSKGLAFTVRNGTDIVANVATTTVEGTLNYGIYCANNINVNGISGTGSATLVFSA